MTDPGRDQRITSESQDPRGTRAIVPAPVSIIRAANDNRVQPQAVPGPLGYRSALKIRTLPVK
jgi:hypothetical protein